MLYSLTMIKSDSYYAYLNIRNVAQEIAEGQKHESGGENCASSELCKKGPAIIPDEARFFKQALEKGLLPETVINRALDNLRNNPEFCPFWDGESGCIISDIKPISCNLRNISEESSIYPRFTNLLSGVKRDEICCMRNFVYSLQNLHAEEVTTA